MATTIAHKTRGSISTKTHPTLLAHKERARALRTAVGSWKKARVLDMVHTLRTQREVDERVPTKHTP